MTRPRISVVSVLPAAHRNAVDTSFGRIGSDVSVEHVADLTHAVRLARHGRGDLLLVTNDATGNAALSNPDLLADLRVAVLLGAVDSPTRSSARETLRGRGASWVVAVRELTLAVAEAITDGLHAPNTTEPVLPKTSAPLRATDLNLARTMLTAALGELIHQPPGAAPFFLVVVEIARFGVLGDSMGSEATVRLLSAVTERLESTVRASDTVSYLGNGRFGVLAVEPDDGALLARLQAVPAQPFRVAGSPVFVELSIGMTHSTRQYDTPEDVIRDGIIAARSASRTRSPAVFKTAMRLDEAEEVRMASELAQSVVDRDFELHYQPIVRLPPGSPVGFEALLRWESPSAGRVSPARFIPILEATDMIVELGGWILERAAAQCAAWNQWVRPSTPFVVSVNVSTRQLRRPELVEQVAQALRNSGLHPSCLKLELTETAMMDEPESVVAVLQRCKQLGVQIWVDDFGTGYSSLSYIRRFNVDGLKLDRAFVDPLDGTDAGSAMARAVMQIAQIIECPVVAEGIETATQASELVALGCSLAQGYHFARPMGHEDATEYLSRGQ